MAPELSDFWTDSLRSSPHGDRIIRILKAALLAADPEAAVRRFMKRSQNELEIGASRYNLEAFKKIFLIGVGKAGAPMARAVVEILDNDLTQGILLVKDGYGQDLLTDRVEVWEAGHPIPDERGVVASQRILNILRQASEEDLVVCLISGGGSALLNCLPEGITLQDIQVLTRELLACGANIHEINTLRKHLDNLKGGGLCEKAYPATIVTLILSDVIGDPLDRIASGPTAPDPSTFPEASSILDRYHLYDRLPRSIIDHLKKGFHNQIPETPKPGNPIFFKVNNLIVGNNYMAAQAARQQAAQEGLNAILLTSSLQGEAAQTGQFLAAVAQQIIHTGEPIHRPACVIAGGETTVVIHGDGLGGRNQEVALGAVLPLANLPDTLLISLATDGGDGPTDAAGAVVTGVTLQRANQNGLKPMDFLERNDSYHFFNQLNDLLKPGPTFTNVNDLAFIFSF